jgi:16S rRNA processing protein RimM
LIDQQPERTGSITAVDDYGGNLVFTVGKGRNELLVPYHDDLMIEFDPRRKKIVMHCPKACSETLERVWDFATYFN